MTEYDRAYNEDWDDPENIPEEFGGGEYPPDWTARCHRAFNENNEECQNCGWTREGNEEVDRRLHGKHIIPPSSGGTHSVSNIATLCSECYTPDLPQETQEKSNSIDDEGEETTTLPEQHTQDNEQTTEEGYEEEYSKFVEFASRFDIFGGDPDEYGRFTAYQAFLRLGLFVSLVAVAVMFVYQIALAIYSTANEVTLQYAPFVYAGIIVLPFALGYILDYKAGPHLEEVYDDAPTTHTPGVQLASVIAFICATILLGAHVVSTHPLNAGGVVKPVVYVLIAGVYSLAVALIGISVLSGSLDARHRLGCSIRPMIWIGGYGALLLAYGWTWVFTGTPLPIEDSTVLIHTPDTINTLLSTYLGTELKAVSHWDVLAVTRFAFPIIGVLYVLRVTWWRKNR